MGFATVLSDLSKLFPYGIFIAKLSAYGFGEKSLTFINVYQQNRKKGTTQIESTFSELLSSLFDVSKDSIIGPVSFITVIIDLFIKP